MKKYNPENRIIVLIFAFVLLGLLIWGRFFYLSVILHDYYTAKAKNINDNSGVVIPRGSIFLTDKNNLPYAAALNKEFSFIYAVPQEVSDPTELAKKLAPILELDESVLTQKLSKKDDPYEILKRKVSDTTVEAIKALKEKALGVDSETLRYYPEGLHLSQVIGFLGFNKNGQAGQYGLEEYYDEELSGLFSSADLILTIDSAIQVKAGTLLVDAVKEWGADSGSIIVMNPKNGALLAMASFPEFDANSYSAVSDKNIFMNPATLKRYEPGSVFKPLTMSIGIETGAVTPETEYYNTGSVKVADRIMSNSIPDKILGWQTMTMVLEQSLNTGAVFVQQKIPKDVFLKYLKNFGVDSKTGIDVSEMPGDISPLLTGRDVNFATASFGQGVAVTPVELLRALSAVTNGGKLIQPHLVSKIVFRDGNSREFKETSQTQIISPETSAKVVNMLVKVIENGSGRRAQIKGYTIAGKTGTAQIPDLKNGGYLDENIHTFVAFAPAYDPKFIALIKLDSPKGSQFSESTVVPVFKNLAQFIFSYLEIPPDKPVEQQP
ncbi:MAG: penicillin-binding protein 2 [Candidatus Azambacteria bacterium]|nr:penicillin-binding protein 2 [Candidatus Azambacteria bacterium]